MDSSEIIRRESRIIRGAFGPNWRTKIRDNADRNGIDLPTARRLVILDIIEPMLGYSIKELKADHEDVLSQRQL